MRSHAKASTAGSTGQRATVALIALAALGALFLSAAPAFAASVTDRPFLFSFDGSDATAGKFQPDRIAVDDASGFVYVSETSPSGQTPSHHAVSKFNPDGTAANFSATGTSSLSGTSAGSFPQSIAVAVDNSGGPTQGRIYVAFDGSLVAFASDGSALWERELGFQSLDVAVDTAGHPWLLGDSSVTEFANSGSPPGQIDSFAVSGSNGLDFDSAGNLYVAGFSGVDKYVGGVFDSTIDASASSDVYVDQSVPNGHVFVAHEENFEEYNDGGTLIGAYGASSINRAKRIAYNPTLDRVYLGDQSSNLAQAYGPEATGTTPDPTIEASTAIGPGTAEFHGAVNPQSVPNAYYFEWANFEHTARSPLQSLPEDSSSHSVSFKATDIFGNVPTNVRLIGVNTSTGLRSSSGYDEFTSPQATEPPAVTIGTPTAITSFSAKIAGTINPHLDSVRWQVRTSTDTNCSGFFEQAGLQYLPGGEVSTPAPVEFELKDLLPAQHYCAFIEANNSFQLFGDGSQSETKEFTTEAIPPSEVSTAFAAPRTDTTARINGFVNPEGETDVTYRFEVSEDGVNWTALPDRESSRDARSKIAVSEELTNLKPSTTYYYRLGLAENDAGPSVPGAVKTFTTRSTAEVTLPERGYELVSNPDKGDQNVYLPSLEVSPAPRLSPDGERAVWTVIAGAPGSPGGTLGTFLAERTASGWHSKSLAPPAAEEIGGGNLYYQLGGSTPDMSRFVAELQEPSFIPLPETTLARLDRNQSEQVLGSYAWSDEAGEKFAGADLTDDAAHVLGIDPTSHQLEDIGSGSPEVISLMPDGAASSCALQTQGDPSFMVPGGDGATQWHRGYHSMSATDASLVYFKAKPNGECSEPWGLYLRDRRTEETIAIDTGTAGAHMIEVVRATPDGHQVYFVTFSKLDPADANADADLYRWDRGTEEATCLTCVVADAQIQISNGQPTAVMVSDDFSHAYFQSEKQLVGDQGIAGLNNIYVVEGGSIHYATTARLAANDSLSEDKGALSADGKALVFASLPLPSLTADAVVDGKNQLYRYDDRDGSVECLTCAYGAVTTGSLGGETSGRGLFNLSADGSTVAFLTTQALVPRDVNHGFDIYEWRGGLRRLITDGVSDPQNGGAEPKVNGIDADGSDILFSVDEPGLTGFEQDSLASVYDARIGGGFERPSPVVHCDGESCNGPIQPPPDAGRAASSAFSGSGNLPGKAKKRQPCAKKRGKAKRRCVRKHKSKAHKARARRNPGRGK